MSTTASESTGSSSPAIKIVGRLLAAAIVAAIGSVAQHDASAQSRDRTGKEVVDAVCAACHGTGAQGAPKIGDAKAWSKRAAQGLTALTQNAINGLRQMPAHGGIPRGKDYYDVNISLVDGATKADIADAQVEATVEEPGLSVQTEKLELMALEKRVSYGNYFRMPAKDPYSIEVRIWRPGAPAPVSTKFSFRHG